VRRNGKGVVDQARRMFILAYGRGCWGLPGPKDYSGAAERLGYPTKRDDFKNARRRGGMPQEGTIPADAPGVRDFITAVRKFWPNFEAERLVSGVTSANEYSFPEVTPAQEIRHFQG
jgi:hypothetical protein